MNCERCSSAGWLHVCGRLLCRRCEGACSECISRVRGFRSWIKPPLPTHRKDRDILKANLGADRRCIALLPYILDLAVTASTPYVSVTVYTTLIKWIVVLFEMNDKWLAVVHDNVLYDDMFTCTYTFARVKHMLAFQTLAFQTYPLTNYEYHFKDGLCHVTIGARMPITQRLSV